MEKNTIGKAIGKVKKTCTVRQYKGATGQQVTITIDYTYATDDEIRQWLSADRVIAGQRVWRSLSVDEIKELNGQTFQASLMGQKIKSRAEKIQDQMNNYGLDEKLATFAVDNPEKWQAIIAQTKAQAEEALAEQDEQDQDEEEDLDTLEEENY